MEKEVARQTAADEKAAPAVKLKKWDGLWETDGDIDEHMVSFTDETGTKRPDKLLKVGPSQVILHQVITRAQGKKYCETLPAPFEHYGSEFSGGMTIEKTNIDMT